MGTKILFSFLILSSLISLSDAARNRTRTNRNRSQREGRQRVEVILSCTIHNVQCAQCTSNPSSFPGGLMQGVPEEGLIHSKSGSGSWFFPRTNWRKTCGNCTNPIFAAKLRNTSKSWDLLGNFCSDECQDDDDDVIREQLQCILNSFACSDKILPENLT